MQYAASRKRASSERLWGRTRWLGGTRCCTCAQLSWPVLVNEATAHAPFSQSVCPNAICKAQTVHISLEDTTVSQHECPCGLPNIFDQRVTPRRFRNSRSFF